MPSTGDTPSFMLGSSTPAFNIKEDCLYCAQKVTDYSVESKTLKYRRKRSHDVMKRETLQSIIVKADDRSDEWGEIVNFRISNEYDLVTANKLLCW